MAVQIFDQSVSKSFIWLIARGTATFTAAGKCELKRFFARNYLFSSYGIPRLSCIGTELNKVYVLPAFKGRRIGKLLLDKAFETAKFNKKNIFGLGVIDTNKETVTFYEKNGFKLHSQTRVNYPKFREELKGMWRMLYKLG